jgi:hypothetical protein
MPPAAAEDGWLDLAVTSRSTGVSVRLNQSARFPAEVDGDGDVDLAVEIRRPMGKQQRCCRGTAVPRDDVWQIRAGLVDRVVRRDLVGLVGLGGLSGIG